MFALVTANVVNAVAQLDADLRTSGRAGARRRGLGVGDDARADLDGRLPARRHSSRAPAAPRSTAARSLDRSIVGRIKRLVALGFPAASQVTLEVGVFAAATALAGKLDPVSSGSHQIALNIAALAFMVPLGLSSAGAVRVGHAIGARDPAAGRARRLDGARDGRRDHGDDRARVVPLAGASSSQAFTTDQRVIDIGVRLLAIAAAFQLFDGTQAVVTGVLRGIGETRMPMIINVIGHWLFGLPVGYALCFWYAWGVSGLWVGLSIGLIFTALVLTVVWWNRTRAISV